MNPPQKTLRDMRVLHAVYLLTVALYIYVLVLMRPQEHDVPLAIVISLVGVSAGTIAQAMFFRSRKVTPAVEILRRNPEDASALANWRFGNVLSFTLAEAIVLFGFALKYLGAEWRVAGLFFAVGTFLFLVWTPRLDVSATG